MNPTVQARRPAARRNAGVQQQVDVLGLAIDVEPEAAAAIEPVFNRADRPAEQPRHLAHIEAVFPGARRSRSSSSER